MHFIDFLLQLICIICWTLKSIYIFGFEYVIPVIGYVLPVLTKYLSQLLSLLIRVFFTYVSPCIIQVLNGTTYVFTKILNGIGIASMKIIESEVNLEYAHAVIVVSVIAFIIYFRIIEKIMRIIQGFNQMILLYIRILLNIGKLLRFCLNFTYRKASALLFRTREAPDGVETISKNGKKHQNHTNGINGSTHHAQDE